MRTAAPLAAFCLACAIIPPRPALAQGAWVNREGCYCGVHPRTPLRFEVVGSGTESERSWAAAQLLYWGRYADIFDPCVDYGTGAPDNGKNEMTVAISPEDMRDRYGIRFGDDVYTMTILFPESGFGVFDDCRDFSPSGCGTFTEVDIVFNDGFSGGWSADPFDFGKASIQATAVHELGHAWGAHHVFNTSPYEHNAFSVMNYMSDYGMMKITRMDANTIRDAYPDRERPVRDIGIYPLKYRQGQYAESYASAPATAAAGSAISVGPFTVQNCGVTDETKIYVYFYLSRDTVVTSDDPCLGGVCWDGGKYLKRNEEWSGTWPLSPIPANVVGSGSYYIGAIVTVWGAEDDVPENNRMLLVDVKEVDGAEYPSGLRQIEVTNWMSAPVPTPAATPAPPSFGGCCVAWCGDNYLELRTSPAVIDSGGDLALDYSCSFDDVNYYGVPVDVYLALVWNPVIADCPSTLGQALSGGRVYLSTEGLRDVYVFKTRVYGPTWRRVAFPPQPVSGTLNLRLTAPPGRYCWAAAFVDPLTGRFIRADLPVENSNSFVVR